jgi:hypothetical protein
MKITKIIFVCVFLASIAAPVIFIDRKTVISMLERRQLAPPPQIYTENKLDINRLITLPQQLDAYIIDRIAWRSKIISVVKWVDFFVLHKNHDRKLLVGKDRWLFYIDKSLGDEFANFKKSNLFTSDEMEIFKKSLELINDVCERNGIKFIFLIVPTTSSVYPEKYPFPRPPGISRAEQIIAALPENLRQKVVFPLDYLILKKKNHVQPLYYNNGLHWTKLGAYYAFDLLYKKLKMDFLNLPELQFKFVPYMDPGEDNYAMLWWGIKEFGGFMELLNVEPVNGWENHYIYVQREDVQENEFNTVIGDNSKKGKYGIVTRNRNGSLPTALVMRDSYFVDLEPFISSIFSKVEYVWTQPEKRTIKYLERLPEKPDVFIWEIAERGMEAIPMVEPGIFPWD